jgi:hypothetical protein
MSIIVISSTDIVRNADAEKDMFELEASRQGQGDYRHPLELLVKFLSADVGVCG